MIGKDIHKFARQLWPLNRSITGEGVRETLRQIHVHLPKLTIKSVPSGTQVFDWTVPKEWAIHEAYLITPSGKKICDFSKNNLHVMGYSIPVDKTLSLDDLRKHLYTLPEQPDAIPYHTSYYKDNWGFCLSKNDFDELENGNYQVKIDSKLFDGELNYGELIIPGKSKKEILLSTYICHPSMANNELSGPTVVTYLSKWIEQLAERKFTYRIIFIPETIGSITYLSINYKKMKQNIIAGYNVTCVGDNRAYSYLPSRDGNTLSDNVAKHVLNWIDSNYIQYTWLDRGSDERQYCAPGIDLPVASIYRTKFGKYPEYHTSLDNLDNVVTAEGLEGGYNAIKKALELIENNKNYKVTMLGEPQLSKRGLYPFISKKYKDEHVALMTNFISLCDGNTSLLDIAERLKIPAWNLYNIIDELKSHELIIEI
jgi:aminopeptidase-like protein